MKLSYVYLFLILFICACTQDESTNIDQGTQYQLSFTSQIARNTPTRTTDTNWEANDCIGVYMKQTGEQLTAASICNEVENVEFITSLGDGNFIPSGQSVYFPQSSRVDFIAYYPYADLQSPFVYPIDLTNQTDLSAIDLMYADNLTNMDARPNALYLQFKRQLSRVSFKITLPETASHEIEVKLHNITTKADFQLADGVIVSDATSNETITFNTVVANHVATAKAILLPSSSPITAKLQVVYNGKSYSKEITFAQLDKGTQYLYTINLSGNTGDPEINHGNYQHWNETPLITADMLADDDLLYIIHDMPNSMKDPISGDALRNYSMLYSKDLRIAYWVAYPLFEACLSGTSRTDAWGYDPLIPTQYQANLSSGFGNSYDRGHQLPSADRLCDAATNRTTFYYSNMTPQIGLGLNQAIWNNLEGAVRGWVSGTDTLFVVTGAMPPSEGAISREKEMAVPAYYFKALARKKTGQSNFSTIAFMCNNVAYSNSDYMQHALSVGALEEMTGFTFFPHISSSIKTALNTNDW